MFHVKHQPPNNQQEKDSTPQTSPPTTQPSDQEAYSVAGKIHLRQQVEDQKEYAI